MYRTRATPQGKRSKLEAEIQGWLPYLIELISD